MTKPTEEAAYLINKLEVHLNRWLQFDFASRLVWKGGDDVYKAGKKDIVTLYEYWLFFTLYDLVKEKFEINSVSFDGKSYQHLIEPTNDGLNVMLKSGKQTALKGTYTKRNTYKNVDLLKMHAYKDAIRRSGGAYILYPGATNETFRGFQEIIPGLGAFSVNPSPDNADIKELSKFIDQVIDHLLDRTSQREKLSDEIYHIFKEPKDDYNVVHERIPEYVDKEKVFADEVSVLIGFYKNEEHLKWILKNNLYNFRTGTDRGSLSLSEMHLNAKYLILHGKNELETDKIFKLTARSPRIFSQNDLLKNGYPDPKSELYIVFQLERDASDDFGNIRIDLRKLPQFVTHRNSARPFSATLSEVLKSKIARESQ